MTTSRHITVLPKPGQTVKTAIRKMLFIRARWTDMWVPQRLIICFLSQWVFIKILTKEPLLDEFRGA